MFEKLVAWRLEKIIDNMERKNYREAWKHSWMLTRLLSAAAGYQVAHRRLNAKNN